jgi:single-stranded-DNA-specific exonuclease
MAKKSRSNTPLWVYPERNPKVIQEVASELKVHPVIAEILLSRGFTNLEEIHDFLYAKLPNLHDPDLFPDMDQAVQRIFLALEKKEPILIYGDTDVDGITGTSLLVEFLRSLQGEIYFFLPDRDPLRRNLISDALPFLKEHSCRLLITVDCGISAIQGIREVAAQGVDVIVTDHHEPTSKIPHCLATLNPKLINSPYPNRELTGVGVAFKLVHALTNALAQKENAPSIDLTSYLDLVALGTIADMGALHGENRILVRYGLKQIRKSRRIGLAKLFQASDLLPQDASSSDISSRIAPRLNSLGRIADPRQGVELLLLRDPEVATRLSQDLNAHNLERQKIERLAATDIEALLASSPDLAEQKAILLASPDWHPGIIPILATRIAKSYNRPTLLLSIEKGVAKGSFRTIPEFPILPFLRANSELFINSGGHDFAAGLTMAEEHIPELRRRLLAAVHEQLHERDVLSKLYLDAPISFRELTFDFMESLSLLEPFGHENPPPLLYTEAAQVWPPKLIGSDHLKLFLEQGDRMLEGIAFHMGSLKHSLSRKNLTLRIAFTPTINVFLNKASIQLQVKDIQF